MTAYVQTPLDHAQDSLHRVLKAYNLTMDAAARRRCLQLRVIEQLKKRIARHSIKESI